MHGCAGTTQYRSWSDASKTMKRIRYGDKMSFAGRAKSTIYRCRFCAHWHIGRAN